MADPIFAGYRNIEDYGWLPMISQEEYETNESWCYYDVDWNKCVIIAHNKDTDILAWVERRNHDA